MRLKHLTLDVKSVDDQGQPGTFIGYASTFGNKDLQGDVILHGAFADTLKNDFGGTGEGIRIQWNHQDGSPTDVIGRTLSAVEDDKGLLVTASLDIQSNPTAQQTYQLLKDGRVHQMSIGFLPEETQWVSDESDGLLGGHAEIRQIKLFEISVVPVAANQQAEVLEVKAGRAISAANEEKLRRAYDAIAEVLSGLDSDNQPSKADRPKDDDNDSSPDRGKDAGSEKSLRQRIITSARELFAGINIEGD